jgi:Leucine-rich repeat (LRR) protein
VDKQRVIGTQSHGGRTSRRKSILGLSENSQVLSTQLKHFPRWLRICFTALNGVFALVLIALISVQWTTKPSDATCSGVYSSEVWKGCRLKVPFCQNPFMAECDCAVVQMVNYSQAELPKSFSQMRSLIKLSVITGELQRLPNATGVHHPNLVDLEVIANRLVELPEDIGSLVNLLVLLVENNQLRSLPDSVGKLENLLTLSVQNNQLKALPDSVGKLENLLDLYVDNNQLNALPDSVGKLENLLNLFVNNNQLKALPDSVGGLKNLLFLSVDNNQLRSLSDSVGKLKSLVFLRVENNQLKALPESVGELKNLFVLYAWNNSLTSIPDGMTALEYVDVRHNDLTSLPINDWTNAKYIYAAGNPLCPYDFPAGVQGRCETQCSIDCPSVWLGNGFCDDGDYVFERTKDINPNAQPTPNSECNTKACDYDQGDCPI